FTLLGIHRPTERRYWSYESPKRLCSAGSSPSPKAPQLDLRHDESERRPSARRHGPLEPAPSLGRVAVDKIPVANAVAQRGDLDVARVRGREDRIRLRFAAIQSQALRVRVACVRHVGVAVEQCLRVALSTGAGA